MFDPLHAQPREKFETLLETLDEEETGGAGAKTGAMTGLDRLWPRASAPPPQFYGQGGQLEGLYEIERLFAEAPAAEPPAQTSPESCEAWLPIDLITLIARASGRLNLDELRGLRRQCALALHPDRAPPAQRQRAQQLMAEANAAIDRALAELVRPRRHA